jgi:hypothetical protein
MASMLSLLDVLPRHERVDVGGGQLLDIFGISAEDIGRILERYPNAFEQIYASGGQLARMDPGLLGALLAASSRNGDSESLLGNEKAEKFGRGLGISDQMKIVQAVGRCTFPDGVGPFLESLASMSSSTSEAIDLIIQVGSKDRPTASQPTPKPSEPPDTPVSGS